MKYFSILLGVFLAFGVGFGAELQSKIENLIKKNVGQDVKVLKIHDLKATSSIKLAIVKNKDMTFPIFVSSDGGVLIGASNVFLSADKADEVEVSNIFKQAQASAKQPDQKEVLSFLDSLSDSEFISIKATSKAVKTTYIVADPNCPACQKEIKDIEKYLKDSDVKILAVGFLGIDSAKKASMLRIALLDKDDKAKIKILKETFKPNSQIPARFVNDDISDIERLNAKVAGAGIQSVPYIVERVR